MAEYIERDAALREIERREALMVGDKRVSVDAMKSFIKNRPAADVAPVVRCRDCKHFQHYGRTSLFIDGKHVKAGWCTRRFLYDEEYRMLPDDFCSCGRRREGSDAQD